MTSPFHKDVMFVVSDSSSVTTHGVCDSVNKVFELLLSLTLTDVEEKYIIKQKQHFLNLKCTIDEYIIVFRKMESKYKLPIAPFRLNILQPKGYPIVWKGYL